MRKQNQPKREQLPSSALSPIINKITVDDKAMNCAEFHLESSDLCDLVEHRIIPHPGDSRDSQSGSIGEHLKFR